MYSLFLDTHGKDVVVILYKDGKVICNETLESNNKHSVITVPTIKNVFEKNKLDIKNLNEIFVVIGPGSFTGVRIAVTIAKTIAYSLNIPIKTIDSLMLMAVCIDNEKCVSISDRNGAFIGYFDALNKPLKEYVYINKNEYEKLLLNEKVYNEVNVDYEKIYEYLEGVDAINPHSVKPLYVKGISALNG